MPARVYLTEAILLGPGSFQLFQALAPRVSPWLAGPLVFALTLLAGDLLLALFWRERAAAYLEEALFDTVMFALLGLLAAVVYQAVELYLKITPNLGIIATLVFLLFLSFSERGRGEGARFARYRRG
ncbi:MAG TPA: hypothetical protein GXX50_06475 [Firmicutes bacterium]|jgi:hypothetical protein|uniref:hypothetical protein n=1 Tax=Gelria sp. Kuro-4 TaxID=2796927 RepID=UPI00199CA0AC|nr:hypothetical protein [Gelria sp. Kuro-4]BCV23821.1 hypothetical protein kuro4_05940 [Gelria sp. Kuro-4]HHV57395.1 hypothetical protein [Bacillota bacterium]